MRIALISITARGGALSARLAAGLSDAHSTVRYSYERYADGDTVTFESLSGIAEELFRSYDGLIFVCACGIAVRTIAPYIRKKTEDPAVVVLDDCGRFAVSLLSGHLGGANELARRAAQICGAEPVITTATDSGGRFSPDLFAAANNLIITDMDAAKEIAAAVLAGEKIGLVSEYEFRNTPPDVEFGALHRTGIYIGTDSGRKPFEVTLQLIPADVTLGIGCKKGTPAEQIETAVMTVLEKNNIDLRRICGAASIDLKASEPGLHEFCRKYSLSLSFYTAQELNSIEGDFTSSDFVASVTGCGNVCERSAVYSGGTLIIRKTALNGVTVAAAIKETVIDFERKML